MKVILLENITSLGVRGDIKDVSDGYASNFLLPQKKALIASLKNVVTLQAKDKSIDQAIETQKADYQKIKNTLNKQSISFFGKVSAQQHLFQGIQPANIVRAIKDRFNLDIQEKWLVKHDLLKEVGRHKVELNLPSNEKIYFFVNIQPEENKQ
jgi:large subunit ribosomal protein L9